VNVPAPGSLMEQSNKAALAAANTQRAQSAAPIQAPTTGALSDEAIATNMKTQAERMAAEAQSLLAESQRMQAEANAMLGVKATTSATKKRGRPAKAKA
jgi:hypothetical protein